MTTLSQEITLITIETGAKAYAKDRDNLTSIVTLLDAQIEAMKRAALPDIKRAVARAVETRAHLHADIDLARHLFIKPRTIVFHGIKCGLQKGKGAIDWDDDEKTVALIEKHFSKAQADLLIKTTKKPIAKALADLDVVTLKKLGCTIEETGDQIVVTAVDTAVDKLVAAFLKAATEEAESAAS